jgi:small subunit ribosomal protein S20
MAVTKTAKLAIKKSQANKIINDRRKKTMKDTVKAVRSNVAKKDVATAEAGLSAAFKALDKAAKRGVIKKNQASRKKSRLAQAIAKAK